MEFRRVLFRSEDLIEELEGVALLDLALEIDVVAEGADRLGQHGVRHLAVGRGDREAAVDGAFGVGELAGHRAVDRFGKELVALAAAADLDVAFAAGAEIDGQQDRKSTRLNYSQ